MCLALAACGGGDSTTPTTFPSVTSTATIDIDETSLGAQLPDDAFGISFEAKAVAQLQFSNGNLARYLKALGPGVLRVGGNSSDLAWWTSLGEPAPSWATSTLTPDSLRGLASVADESGWDVVLGVNLKHVDAQRAADEVRHAHDELGPKLRAVAIGNEPNVYYDDIGEYWRDFASYVSAIRGVVADVAIVGPELESNTNAKKFTAEFVRNNQTQPLVSAFTQHVYAATACSGKRPTIDDLLDEDTYDKIKDTAATLRRSASAVNATALLDETNSVSCGGREGVSDVYAAALWSVAHGASVTSQGVEGVYFHGAIGQCSDTTTGFNWYTPFCAPTAKDYREGRLRPQPLYYGLAALGSLPSGRFVRVENQNARSLHVFAMKTDKGLTIVAVNADHDRSAGSTELQLRVGATYSHGSSVLLSQHDNDVSMQNGISLGGSTVAKPGALLDPKSTPVTVAGGVASLLLPPAGVGVVTLS
jgi:hypothetical protein